MSMSETQKTIVDDWIQKHGYNKCRHCDAADKVVVSDKSHYVGEFFPKDPNAKIPVLHLGSGPQVVMLTCRNCGNVVLLNPQVVPDFLPKAI